MNINFSSEKIYLYELLFYNVLHSWKILKLFFKVEGENMKKFTLLLVTFVMAILAFTGCELNSTNNVNTVTVSSREEEICVEHKGI